MHRFWRATISVVTAYVLGFLLLLTLWLLGFFPFDGRSMGPWQLFFVAIMAMGELSAVVIPWTLVVEAAYGLLTLRCGPRPIDLETRFRFRGYVLRGITGPRCRECGTAI